MVPPRMKGPGPVKYAAGRCLLTTPSNRDSMMSWHSCSENAYREEVLWRSADTVMDSGLSSVQASSDRTVKQQRPSRSIQGTTGHDNNVRYCLCHAGKQRQL